MAAMNPPKPNRAAALTPSQVPPTLVISKCDQSALRANRKAPTPTNNTRAILIPDKNVATPPLTLTARQLIPVTMRIEARATTCSFPRELDDPTTVWKKNLRQVLHPA